MGIHQVKDSSRLVAALREKLFTGLCRITWKDGIVPQIRKKKAISFKMVFLLLIFKLTLGFFNLFSRLFRCQITSVSCLLFFAFFTCVCVRSRRAFVFLKI